MALNSRRLLLPFLLVAAVFLLASGSMRAAEDHILKPTELHDAIVTAVEARQDHRAKINRLFSSDAGKKALGSAKIDSRKIETAVSLLSDQELARLAARAEKIQTDFSAGALSNQELTYIVIALATAVIILVIVVA